MTLNLFLGNLLRRHKACPSILCTKEYLSRVVSITRNFANFVKDLSIMLPDNRFQGGRAILMFWVEGCAIRKGSNFRYFGIRDDIDFTISLFGTNK